MAKKVTMLLLVLLLSPTVQAKVSLFSCEPEWGALASEIGGDKISNYTATTARQDPHLIEARPSLLAKSRQADLLFCTGADLETGWLPILLKKSGNPRIQPGQPGHLMAADYVELLEVLGKVERGMGDVHATGNPHIHLDPRNILPIAKELTNRLVQIDSDNSHYYKSRLSEFQSRWKQALKEWKKEAAVLSGMRIVVHHRSWVYLESWLGLKEIAALEPKPGVPSTSKHLAQLVSMLETQPAEVIMRSPYQDSKSSQWLSKKTGIPAVVLPYTVGGSAEANSLFNLYEHTILLLRKAIQ